MLDNELPDRPQTQQHGHAAIAAVTEAAQSRTRTILVESECQDIAEPTAVEISRGGVMYGVGFLPVAKGKQRDQSQTGADPVVRSEERRVGKECRSWWTRYQ